MAAVTGNSVLHHLQHALLLRDGGGMTDGQLLDCFLARREEAAFEALVRRHGPMVLGVCRRLLPNEHDAEDAFQATFLVLARKAGSVVPRDLVGNWLYGVAYRTALKAKAAAARRRVMERQVKAMPKHPTEPDDVWHELQPLLDQELQRLPDKYRVPVVLCDLERRTRKEVARHLGIPEGTLSSRLATARRKLATRLARHGLALSAVSLALALSQNAVSAPVPTSLLGSTVTAATRFTAGQATAGLISAEVAALTDGVLRTMLLTRLRAAAVLLALGVFAAGAPILFCQTPAPEREESEKPHLNQRADTPPAPGLLQADQKDNSPKNDKDDGQQSQIQDGPKKPKDEDEDDDEDDGQKYQGVVQSLDVSRNTITLTVRRKGKDVEQTFDLARHVQVQVAGKASALSGVTAGMSVALKLSGDRKAVVGIKEAKGQQEKEHGPKSNKKVGPYKGGD
jgi:RNA polymerase sigma factor (sigma-70 family)